MDIAPTSRNNRKFPLWEILFGIVILAGVTVLLYPHAAAWISQKEQSQAVAAAQAMIDTPPNNSQTFRDEQMALAHQYNDTLESGALLKANSHVPTSDSHSDATLDYTDLLNPTGTGFMGRLIYRRLGIDLPIYHGTTSDILEKGVGHLEGTSLPVGGAGTRAVLTAHRGLATATLFDHLDQARVGDTFTISVLDEVLAYRVVDTQVIAPDDSAAVLPQPQRDLVTLVTCTPLGINTHRILVTGERITPVPAGDVAAAQETSALPGFPWWAIAWMAATPLDGFFVVWSYRHS